jgi:putative ABC transport system permease protein
MQRVRAGWLSFRRIHLAALIADWRRTLLSVIGVAVGVTVVLGTLILKSELARPFDAFGPSLTYAADIGVVEVTPNVSGRLPIETVNRLRADVAGADAVIPIVAGLTPVDVAGGTHGFFLLGGSCQIELLVGSFNCEQRAHEKPADGPGVPLARAGPAPRACQNDAGAESLSRARPMVCPSARNWSGCPPQRKHASATSATRVAARLD